jgi:hypothetical protein
MFYLFLGLAAKVQAQTKDACYEWFAFAKIAKGHDCEMKCAMLDTDMGTFDCPARCSDFCREQPVVNKILGTLVYYPLLNPVERTLIKSYPKEAILVYKAKGTAEGATKRNFHRNDQDDESDAFRHFVWAAAMREDLSAEMAKKFLDAHESNEPDSDPGKAMDLANNRAGLLAAESLLKAGKLNQEEIEKAALNELRNKTLIVLKPKGGPK